MKTLDRYIVKNFVIGVLLCFVVLMSMRVVADLFVNIDDFTRGRDQQTARTAAMVVGDIVTYYGYRSLTYLRELGAVIIVAAAVFTLWRMNHTNELTAVLASGVSLHRVLLPIVLSSIGLNLVIMLDSEVFIPLAKYQLVRNRDDPAGTEVHQVRLLTDGNDSSWYSQYFYPAEGRLLDPIIILRDENLAYLGHITAPMASYSAEAGGWLFLAGLGLGKDKSIHQAMLQVPGWRHTPTTAVIPTVKGPAQIIEEVRAKPANRNVNWRAATGIKGVQIDDPDLGLTITARRMGLKSDGDVPYGTTLEQPQFVYRGANRRVWATFTASQATYSYDPHQLGWTLRDGKLLYASDLTPGDLSLRQAGNWLSYMSTVELNGLLRLQRVPDPQNAMLVRHSRFADFFNNLIMLLVAVPFILSRERNLKASAGLTVLMVGVVYVFVYLTRYIGLPPALAAWLPILVFGPVATFMLDSVKT